MVRELITQPLRVAASTTRAGAHVAADALAVGLTVTEQIIEHAVPHPEPPVVEHSYWGVEVVAVPPAEQQSDPDAPDGAPALVHADEPWDGYAHMNAHDVVKHLTGASAEEATLAERYERTHAQRKTVLTAAERRLRRTGGAATAANGAGRR